MIRLFTGWDAREALGWHAFTQKAIERSTERLSIVPLSGEQRDGSNSFIYARFEVPALCGYEGWAIFADASDMVCRADIAELWALRDERYAVQVVKHDYRTKHHRKYVGTEMECDNRDYPRKNWSSLMLLNNAHPANRFLSAENVRESSGADLHRFCWLPDELIGSLPIEWNWLAQEHGTNAQAKIIHYTAGIPQIPAYTCGSHSSDWFDAATSVYRTPAPMKLHAAA